MVLLVLLRNLSWPIGKMPLFSRLRILHLSFSSLQRRFHIFVTDSTPLMRMSSFHGGWHTPVKAFNLRRGFHTAEIAAFPPENDVSSPGLQLYWGFDIFAEHFHIQDEQATVSKFLASVDC